MLYKCLKYYIILSLFVCTITPFIGVESLPVKSIFMHLFGDINNYGEIFFNLRLPRVLLCFMCGGGLAITGAAFQAIFRNSLVDPYTLGVAGGAAVGAYISVTLSVASFSFLGFNTQQLLALIGAFVVIALTKQIAASSKTMHTNTMLLGGLTLSIICSGVILFLSYIATPHQLITTHRWVMGGFDYVGYSSIAACLPFFLPSLGVLIFYAPPLNILSFGDEAAHGLGVDTNSVYSGVFFAGGIMTATVVSLAGPISFIGLIIPHCVRFLSGYDHRVILPASFLLGGAVLCICDTIARCVMNMIFASPTELPVGIITAILGGPIFIKMLFNLSKNNS